MLRTLSFGALCFVAGLMVAKPRIAVNALRIVPGIGSDISRYLKIRAM